jgi:hypothetical protein
MDMNTALAMAGPSTTGRARHSVHFGAWSHMMLYEMALSQADRMTGFEALLDAAAADPKSSAWTDIWRQSCHQGTCDPASAALLPWLATTCAAFAQEDRVNVLVFAAAIAVDADGTGRRLYANDIATLRAMTLERLAAGTSDDATFVYLLQAVLAFEGDETWGKELDRVIAREVDIRCPMCEREALIEFQPDLIEPGLSSELARRVHAAAEQAGRDQVATAFTYLFGRTSCTSCGTRFAIADNL